MQVPECGPSYHTSKEEGVLQSRGTHACGEGRKSTAQLELWPLGPRGHSSQSWALGSEHKLLIISERFFYMEGTNWNKLQLERKEAVARTTVTEREAGPLCVSCHILTVCTVYSCPHVRKAGSSTPPHSNITSHRCSNPLYKVAVSTQSLCTSPAAFKPLDLNDYTE